MIYIFDIDGTLTPSRLEIDPEFKEWFSDFVDNNRVWLVTGSDKDKTIEQIGYDLWEKVERAYQCSGNVLYQDGELVEAHKFELPDYYETMLNILLDKSEYPVRAGNQIEKRFGVVNFSIVGRNCTQEQRDAYYEWDKESKERELIVWELNERYPWIEAAKGGQISIDIYTKGSDKGQIVSQADAPFAFFGDHLEPGGNDYPVKREVIKQGIKGCSFYPIKNGWQETWSILTDLK